MIKRDNLFFDNTLYTFNEDLYFVDMLGRVVASREEKSRGIKNIFAILDSYQEENFFRKNILLTGKEVFMLLSTTQGPMILYCPLFVKKRVIIAIIPNIPEHELLSLIKEHFFAVMCISPKMKEKLRETPIVEMSKRSRGVGRILALINDFRFYRHNFWNTNDELAEMMLDIANAMIDITGCEFEWDVKDIGMFEMRNEICFESYTHILFVMFLMAREYSADRSGKATIFFGIYGVSVRISFKIAEIHSEGLLRDKSKAIAHLLSYQRMGGTIIDFNQENGIFTFNAFPWREFVETAYIKSEPKEFIYDI